MHTPARKGLAACLLAPIHLIIHWCLRFTQMAQTLRNERCIILSKRRDDWRKIIPQLIRNEFNCWNTLVSGLAVLQRGDVLDLDNLERIGDPANFHASAPASAEAAHKRIEAVMRFLADPEKFIRRYAARASKTPLDFTAFRNAPASATPIGEVASKARWRGISLSTGPPVLWLHPSTGSG